MLFIHAEDYRDSNAFKDNYNALPAFKGILSLPIQGKFFDNFEQNLEELLGRLKRAMEFHRMKSDDLCEVQNRIYRSGIAVDRMRVPDAVLKASRVAALCFPESHFAAGKG